jgi:hypothetical protein
MTLEAGERPTASRKGAKAPRKEKNTQKAFAFPWRLGVFA